MPSEDDTAGLTRVDFSVPIQDDLDFENLSGVFPCFL